MSGESIGDTGSTLKAQIFTIQCDTVVTTYCGWTVADLSKAAQPDGDVPDKKDEESAEAVAIKNLLTWVFLNVVCSDGLLGGSI